MRSADQSSIALAETAWAPPAARASAGKFDSQALSESLHGAKLSAAPYPGVRVGPRPSTPTATSTESVS